MNHRVSIFIAIVAFCCGSSGSAEERLNVPASPDKARVMTGQVAYSDPNASARSSQIDTLNAIDDWSAKLQTILTTSGEGRSPELDQDAVSYLSVLYLFCSAKRGPCPFILEAILDSDIALSRTDNAMKCPLTTRFFKSYVSQSLDERGKFLFSLTQGLEMSKFNTTVRPRFVDCKETVSAMIADKDILSQRFGSKGSAAGTVAELRAFLSEVRDAKVDIFRATAVTRR